MTKLKTYLKLFLMNASLEICQVINDRWFFVFDLLVTLVFQSLWPLISAIIYTTTSGIPGWSLGEFIIFQGTSTLVFGIAGTLIFNVVFDISWLIETGRFDQFLLKPLKLIPHIMVINFNPWFLGDLIAGVSITVYGVLLAGIQVTLENLLLYIYLVFIGFLVYLGFVNMIIMLNFKFYKVHNLMQVFWELRGVTSYPLNIYGRWLTLMFTFVLPLGIANYYPSQALIGRLTETPMILLLSLGVMAFVGISMVLLKLGVKYYSSAGG